MALKSLKDMICCSCGRGIVSRGSSHFPCPLCGESIARCGSCREQAVAYTCPKCGAQGP